MAEQVILWVDDDIDDLDMFRQAAGEISASTRMVQARNGQEALDYLKQVHAEGTLPCLIVLDMNMPKLGGRETLVSLKTNPDYKHINVIIFTTSNSPLDKTFCDRFGVEMFTKPQSYDNLKELIRKFIGICSHDAS
jgi:CheY-like chemotaxis protein